MAKPAILSIDDPRVLAAVYGASEGLKVTLLDGDAPGGQAGTSSRIENYLHRPRLQGKGRGRGVAAQTSALLLETSVPGVFAAGDVRAGSVKRVASAVGEGSITVQFVHQYLAEVGA